MRFSPTTLAIFLVATIGTGTSASDLSRTNDAIEAWIAQIDSDRPYLLLDIGAGELRLQHGAALLRSCPILSAELDTQAVVNQRLAARLRRYGATPFHKISAGLFDWEQYLALEADDECALSFSEGMLIYADAAWATTPVPSVQLAPADLRALFDAAPGSLELILLPADWDLSSTASQD